MGRSYRERRKLTGVSEEKEQKKIRDNILKVLKARSSSPGQGGALLVAEPRTTNKQKYRSSRHRSHQVVSVSTSTDESSCGSSRSMSGRARKRTKSVSLSRRRRKSTKEKKEVEKDTAVSKHLRVAHGITEPQVVMKNEIRSKPNMYTNARITQKVGLISTGRKGAPASRGIIIPEHISRQTEEDIRKMSAEAEADVHLNGDVDAAERLVLGSSDSFHKRIQTPASVEMRPAISACNSVESLRSKHSPFNVDSGKFPEILPVKETVAGLMTSLKFVAKSLFPGRDYLRETQDELLKLVKQNAPRSATPTRLPVFNKITRSGSVQRSLAESFTSDDSEHHSNYDDRRTVADLVDRGSRHGDKVDVENSHTYSFNDHISLVPKIHFTDSNPFQTVHPDKEMPHFRKRNYPNRGLSSLKRTRELIHKKGDNYRDNYRDNNYYHEGANGKAKEYESKNRFYDSSRLHEDNRRKVQNEIRTFYESRRHDRPEREIKGISDLNDLIDRRKFEKENNFFAENGNVFGTPKSPVLASRKKLEMPTSPALRWDSSSMLQTNDKNSQDAGSRDMFEAMEIDVKEAEAVNLLEQNDLVNKRGDQQRFDDLERDRYPADYNRTLDWVDQHSRSRSQCSHCSQGSSDHSSQLQVPTRESNYMPSFHGNYYADHMATGDLSWQQKNHRVKVEAMDILDYVDQCIRRDSRMDCRGDRTTTLGALSPDLVASPPWQATGHPLHRRALLPLPTSPKSPGGPKFYPKKMY